jgi:hypothetical protein
MVDKFEKRETGNGTVQKVPVQDDGVKFTLSEPDQIDDGNGDWGYSILADKDLFLASVSYPNQAGAIRGRIAMAQALEEAIFIATSES